MECSWRQRTGKIQTQQIIQSSLSSLCGPHIVECFFSIYAQLCSGLLSISHAKVHDRDKVTSVKKTADGFLVTSSNGEAKLYDAVVLALPLDHSDIQLEPAARAKIVNRKLQRTHATFVIGQPKLEFFGVRGPQPAGEPDESCPLPDVGLEGGQEVFFFGGVRKFGS